MLQFSVKLFINVVMMGAIKLSEYQLGDPGLWLIGDPGHLGERLFPPLTRGHGHVNAAWSLQGSKLTLSMQWARRLQL